MVDQANKMEIMAFLQDMKKDMSTKADTDKMKQELMASMGAQSDVVAAKQQKTEERIDMITAKLAAMDTRLSRVEATPMEEEEFSDDSAKEPDAKKSRMAGRPRAPTVPRPPPQPASSSNDRDPNGIHNFNEKMVWVKGFPHEMMYDVMEAHSKALVAQIMPMAEASEVKFKAKNFSKQYSLEFASKLQATSFREHALKMGIEWHNTRTKANVPLKCHLDKSLSVRITDSLLYFIYPLVEKHMKDAGKYHPEQGMKLGNTGNPRRFFIKDTDGEGYSLYTIKIDQDKTPRLDIQYEYLEKFGIGKATADAISKEAMAKATSRASA